MLRFAALRLKNPRIFRPPEGRRPSSRGTPRCPAAGRSASSRLERFWCESRRHYHWCGSCLWTSPSCPWTIAVVYKKKNGKKKTTKWRCGRRKKQNETINVRGAITGAEGEGGGNSWGTLADIPRGFVTMCNGFGDCQVERTAQGAHCSDAIPPVAIPIPSHALFPMPTQATYRRRGSIATGGIACQMRTTLR